MQSEQLQLCGAQLTAISAPSTCLIFRILYKPTSFLSVFFLSSLLTFSFFCVCSTLPSFMSHFRPLGFLHISIFSFGASTTFLIHDFHHVICHSPLHGLMYASRDHKPQLAGSQRLVDSLAVADGAVWLIVFCCAPVHEVLLKHERKS